MNNIFLNQQLPMNAKGNFKDTITPSSFIVTYSSPVDANGCSECAIGICPPLEANQQSLVDFALSLANIYDERYVINNTSENDYISYDELIDILDKLRNGGKSSNFDFRGENEGAKKGVEKLEVTFADVHSTYASTTQVNKLKDEVVKIESNLSKLEVDVSQLYQANLYNLQVNSVNNIVKYLQLVEPFSIYEYGSQGQALGGAGKIYQNIYNKIPGSPVNSALNPISIAYFDTNCSSTMGTSSSYNPVNGVNHYNTKDVTGCYFVQQYQLANNQLQEGCTPSNVIGTVTAGASSTSGCVVSPDISTLSTLTNLATQKDIINDINSIVNYLKLVEPFAINNYVNNSANNSITIYNTDQTKSVDGVNNIPSMSNFDFNCASGQGKGYNGAMLTGNHYQDKDNTACYFVQQYQLIHNQLKGQTIAGVMPDGCKSDTTGCVVAPDIKTLSTLPIDGTATDNQVTEMINNITTYIQLMEPFAIYNNFTNGLATGPTVYEDLYSQNPSSFENGTANAISLFYFDINCANSTGGNGFNTGPSTMNHYSPTDLTACYFVQQYQIQHNQLAPDCTTSNTIGTHIAPSSGCIVAPDISTLKIINNSLIHPISQLPFSKFIDTGDVDGALECTNASTNIDLSALKSTLNSLGIPVYSF